MELGNVKFGIELEMFGFYDDEQFINTLHKECEKRLLPIRIMSTRESETDTVPEGYWLIKSDSSIQTPRKGIATRVQQVGYRTGEQQFLPFGHLKHTEPETGIYDTERKTISETKDLIHQELDQGKLGFEESRFGNKPEIEVGDEKIKAFKVRKRTEDDYQDFELVSPPLKFVDTNIKLVGELADVLKRMRMKVNPSTGIHIHISFPEINLFTFIKLIIHIDENKIKDLWPTRFNKNFAKSKEEMKDDIEDYLDEMSLRFNKERDGFNYAKINRLLPLAGEIDDRYFGINIQSLERHGTIEFRYAAGSLNSSEITEWMRYLRDLVDYCIKVKEVNNFLGRFDVKEEKTGNIEIYDSANKITIKSHSVIDEFNNQKKDIKSFLQEKGKDNYNAIVRMIHQYINDVGLIERKNIGNIFNNFIHFTNAVIKENVGDISPEKFYHFFFDLYADPESSLHDTTDEDDEEDESWLNGVDKNKNTNIHEDIFAYILEQTAFKFLDDAQIARFIDQEAGGYIHTENEHTIELVASLVIGSSKNVINKINNRTFILISNYIYDAITNSYSNEGNGKLFSFFKKIGKEKTMIVLNDKSSRFTFEQLLKSFDYSPSNIKVIIDTDNNKDFLITQYKKYCEMQIKNEKYFENLYRNIHFYISTIGADELSKVEIASSKDKLWPIKFFGEINSYDASLTDEDKKFLKNFVTKEASKPDAIEFTKFISKHLNGEKIGAFDIYSALNSLNNKENLNDRKNNIPQGIVSVLENTNYNYALLNGKNYINEGSGEILGFNDDDDEDAISNKLPIDLEKSRQLTIDLFKLLFKKYRKGNLPFIYGFAEKGVDEFIKPEYLINITNKDFTDATEKFSQERSQPKESIIQLFKNLLEKVGKFEGMFVFGMLKQTSYDSSRFNKQIGEIAKKIKLVIDRIDTNKFIEAYKESDKNNIKLNMYERVMESTALDNLDFDFDKFALAVREDFEIGNSKELHFLLNYFYDKYKQNKKFEGASQDWYDSLSEDDKLIVDFYVRPLTDDEKKKLLSKEKDDEFLKKILGAYNSYNELTPLIFRAYDKFEKNPSNSLTDAPFFVEVLYNAGKRLDNNIKNLIKFSSILDFKNRENINYTKLSFLDEEMVGSFLETNIRSINYSATRGLFAEGGEEIKKIFDKIFANKRLYKKFKEYGKSFSNADEQLGALFIYKQLKKANLKMNSTVNIDVDVKSTNLSIEFKIEDKKCKILVDAIADRHPMYVGVLCDVTGILLINGKEIFKQQVNGYGIKQIQYFVHNKILENPALKKFMDKKLTNDNYDVKKVITDAINLFIFENNSQEFKPFKKKKIVESIVSQPVDYQKEFKSIMIKKGVSEAKKFLNENKNFINDKKLIAVMKQFGIR